ncbi:MAG: tetratricopeptide repeat protein [Phycisphaeraceae bacterium]|nr:MAG: tetratricopeptide repeat protein [Phycisphaeraceae bacterium]
MPNIRQNRSSVRPIPAPVLCGFGALLAILAGAPVSAQNALGDGRALDANLQQGRGGINPMGRDIVSELRLRNAIVTGNVPGGFGFRGDIDYGATDDFRAELGSDDIFAFQRDSFASAYGLPGQQLRGSDALRYQMQLSIGGQIDARLGLPVVRSPGAGAGVSDLMADAAGFQGDFSGLRFDPFTLRPGALRSTSDYLAGQVLAPRILGQGRIDDESPMLYSLATPLRGVTLEETPGYVRPLMRRDIEDAQMRGGRDPALQMPGDPAPGQAPTDRGGAADEGESTRPDARLDREPATGRITDGRSEPGLVTGRVGSQRLDHQSVIAELRRAQESLTATPDAADPDREAVDPTEELINRWAPEFGDDGDPDAMDETRPADAEPRGVGAGRPGEVVPIPEFESAPDFDRRVREMSSKLQLPGGRDANGQAQRPAGGFDPVQTLDRGDLIREAEELFGRVTPRIENLAPAAGPERNLFAEHMRAGERALASGRWFDAEERFTSALRMSPGNAMAAVGRVNAQIGAGMFRSAAINLQQLLRTNPELIGVRYDESLLPGDERLNNVRAQLRGIVSRNDDMGRSGAIILGYLGHQFDTPADVREAFHAVDRITRELGDQPDPLYDVLRAVWLRGQRPPADPGK